MSVIKLADVADDSRMWSVTDMLRDAIESLEKGDRKATKALVVFLDDDGTYHVGYNNAGLSSSQAVALLECAKHLFLDDLRGLD